MRFYRDPIKERLNQVVNFEKMAEEMETKKKEELDKNEFKKWKKRTGGYQGQEGVCPGWYCVIV
jgi:hypothetical protein